MIILRSNHWQTSTPITFQIPGLLKLKLLGPTYYLLTKKNESIVRRINFLRVGTFYQPGD